LRGAGLVKQYLVKRYKSTAGYEGVAVLDTGAKAYNAPRHLVFDDDVDATLIKPAVGAGRVFKVDILSFDIE
jgi:hypothetical protein